MAPDASGENIRRMVNRLRTGRWWIYLLATLVLYALAGFLLAPWLTDRALKTTLSERLALDLEYTDLQINPFTLTLKVQALQVTEADGSHLIGFESLFVNFEALSLFNWAWTFDELHLTAPRLDFERLSQTENSIGRLVDRWTDTAPPDASATSPGDDELIRLIVEDFRLERGELNISDRIPTEAFSTSFTPIDLSVEGFSTLPDASGRQQVTISTESGARLAWTGALSVNPLAISGDLTVEGTYTPIVFRYFQDQLRLPITFEGGELDARLNYEISLDETVGLTARISGFDGTLNGLSINQPGHPNLVELGEFTIMGGRVEWPEQIAHIDDIQFNKVIVDAYRNEKGAYLPGEVYTTEPDPGAAPTADGDEREAGEPLSGWQISADRLRLTDWRINHTDTTLDDSGVVITNFGITLTDVSSVEGHVMPFELALAPASGGRLQADGMLELLPDLAISSNLQATDLALTDLQPYLNRFARIAVSQGSASFTGTLEAGPEIPPRFTGNFQIDQLELVDEAQEETLLAWERLALEHLVLTPNALEISSVKLGSPYLRFEIEEDGETNITRTLIQQEPLQMPNETSGGENADGSTFSLLVDEIELTEGSAEYTDLALPLPFDASISMLNGTVSTVDSKSSEPARMNLEGQVNEYGLLRIDGTLLPFMPAAATEVRIEFENVNMPRVSPYTIKFAGRKISDGRTDLSFDYQLKDGELEGNNHLVIRDLKLGEEVDHPGAMSLPLDMAVALLKDPSGTVDFSFPVSGALGDPEFSYSGAVAQAFSNLLLGFVTSPFRLLGSLVGLNAEDIESVSFSPGRSDLTPPQKETLDRLAEALAQRPQLNLAVPPVFDPATDRRALQSARMDEEIDRLLEETQTDQADRRAVVENLYEARSIEPALSTVRDLYLTQDDAGKPVLDETAYLAGLREALVSTVNISDLDLQTLADERARAVIDQLGLSNGSGEDQVSVDTLREVDVDDGLVIHLPLELAPGD